MGHPAPRPRRGRAAAGAAAAHRPAQRPDPPPRRHPRSPPVPRPAPHRRELRQLGPPRRARAARGAPLSRADRGATPSFCRSSASRKGDSPMLPALSPPEGHGPLLHANGHPVTSTVHQATDSGMHRQDIDSAVTEAEPLGSGWLTVTVVIGIMAALLALGGMTLSFRAVRAEMIPSFGARWAWMVPIVVDLVVFVFSGVDLVLARLGMSLPLARWTVYGATFGTVWLNYSAGGGTAGRVAHVLMPAVWVVFVELMRHVVRRQAKLSGASVREPIPAARWIVSPWPT